MPEYEEPLRQVIINEIIYQEAEKLQNEFSTLYYGSGSLPLIPSSIIKEKLTPLFTVYKRPKTYSGWQNLANIAFEGLSVGFSVGLDYAVADYAYTYKYDMYANRREELLATVQNPKLHNAVDQMYRQGASVGDGGLADAVRFELATGQPVGGRSHIQKAIERIRNLENIINSQTLSRQDLEIALLLLEDLKNALGGG